MLITVNTIDSPVKCILTGYTMDLTFNGYIEAIKKSNDLFETEFLKADFIHSIFHQNTGKIATITNDILNNGENSLAFFKRGLLLLCGIQKTSNESSVNLALSDFNRSLILNVKNPFAFYGRAKAWYYRKDFAESLDNARKAKELSSNVSTKINFDNFIFFLENLIKNNNCIEYNIGKHGLSVREIYEKKNVIEPETGWKLIDWDHRFKIRPGSILREYSNPYMASDEISVKEFKVEQEPHSIVAKYKWARGMTIEMIKFEGQGTMQCKHFFNNEIWIREDTLGNPYRKYLVS